MDMQLYRRVLSNYSTVNGFFLNCRILPKIKQKHFVTTVATTDVIQSEVEDGGLVVRVIHYTFSTVHNVIYMSVYVSVTMYGIYVCVSMYGIYAYVSVYCIYLTYRYCVCTQSFWGVISLM